MSSEFKVCVESTMYKQQFVYSFSNIDDAVTKFKDELLEHANLSSLFDLITTIELKRLPIYTMPETTLKTITFNSLIQMGA